MPSMLSKGLSLGIAATMGLLAACASQPPEQTMQVEHAGPVLVSMTDYDGQGNDLLSAGLGLAGVQSAEPPALVTDDVESIRRRAVYMHYRGLIDRSPGGGFGRLFGTALATPIAGSELVAQIPWQQQSFSAVLQIPAHFNRDEPCLVVAPASGSRNAYGALPVVGEWALPRGCALLLHDKGVGAGIATATRGLDARGRAVPIGDAAWQPRGWLGEDGVAFRHMHDGAGVEADWGGMTIAAIRWAITALQQQRPATHGYRKPALTVIAAGVSNGGAAVLRAAELDQEKLIDAVVAGEPNITPKSLQPVQVGNLPVEQVGMPALLHFSEVGLLLPCAIAMQPLPPPLAAQAAQHCQWLRKQHLLSSTDDAALAQQAAVRIRAQGLPQSVFALAPVMLSLGMHQSLLATYGNAAAGSPRPAICQLRAQAPQGELDDYALVWQYTDGSGLPPPDWLGQSADGMPGLSPEQQWCLHEAIREHPQVALSLRAQTASGELGNRPALIVHGRDDALIAVQHSSRPYYALQQQTAQPSLRYIEITHAHHFDAFNALPGYDRLFVPIHAYFLRALDTMWAHLKQGSALPPSQVVRTQQRAAIAEGTEALTDKHLPDWQMQPDASAAIRWQNGLLYIPE